MNHTRQSAIAGLFRQPLGLGIILSLVFSFIHAAPLYGSRAALLLAVASQLVLPGYLLARALGRASGHPLVGAMWTLAAGLGLTIALGAVCRALQLPVPVYLLLLHAIMLALALRRPPAAPAGPRWRLSRANAPLLLITAGACALVFAVSAASRERFYGYEDQALFISLADWLAHNPGQFPNNLPLRTRQIAVLRGDSRLDSDGWTYNHAAWVWVSGVSAADLIWYDLNPLLVWLGPLAVFALAYALTGRESAAAYSAAALALAGLLTPENLVYSPTYTAYGRFAVFQINTLRQFSVTLLLPLALLVLVSCLKDGRRRDLITLVLIGQALAVSHPVVTLLFLIASGGLLAADWLLKPIRARLLQMIPLALALGSLIIVPMLQRLDRSGLGAADTLIRVDTLAANADASADEDAAQIIQRGEFLVLRDLPLVGTTFIRSPQRFFYHPMLAAAAALGLLWGWAWRRSLAARLIFPATALTLLLSFTPGLTAFYNAFAASLGLLMTVFLLPLPLIFGLSFDHLLRMVAPARGTAAAWLAGGAAALAALALLLEPFPMAASPRDQIAAYNLTQAERVVRPFHLALTDSLRALLAGQTTIITLPDDVANVVVEDVSGTLLTGGRRIRNTAYAADQRFYGRGEPFAPWLDSDDIAFLTRYGVTHIVLEADDTRLPQLLTQPERFRLLAEPAGYVVFAVEPGLAPDDLDALFGQMNALYSETAPPRSGQGLGFPGGAAWQPLVEQWAAAPDSDRARLGLAFARLMAGDAAAADGLCALADRYPRAGLLLDTCAAAQDTADAAAWLLARLDGDPVRRALAARALLTARCFPLLSRDQMAQAAAVMGENTLLWEQLADFDQPEAMRRRAALLLYAGLAAEAARALDHLPQVRHAPQDMLTLAGAALTAGDPLAAQALLRPAADPDWVLPHARIHGDRWQTNPAALLLERLQGGDLAAVNNPFVFDAQISRADERLLTVSATFADFTPYKSYPPQTWLAQIISPDAAQVYASAEVPAQFPDGLPTRAALDIALPADVPPLTPALVYLQARYDRAITAPPLTLPITLNRPEAASLPAAAVTVGRGFGDHIRLEAYILEQDGDRLALALYWRAAAPPPEDYQVFVHLLSAAGQTADQRDGAPVEGRYPTSQWRADTLIADPYTFDLAALPPGTYTVQVGLYRLDDLARLPVSPSGEDASADALRLAVITR